MPYRIRRQPQSITKDNDDSFPGIFNHFFLKNPKFKRLFSIKQRINFILRLEIKGEVILRSSLRRERNTQYDIDLVYFYEIDAKQLKRTKDLESFRDDFINFSIKKLENKYKMLSADNIVTFKSIVTETSWKEIDDSLREDKKSDKRYQKYHERRNRKITEINPTSNI